MIVSPGVSSLLFTVAFQTIERQRKQCNLSKRKRLRSIEFSLQLCFHAAAEEGCGALMNDTLMFPSPLPPVSVLGSWALSLQWCESTGMSLHAGTWFSSMPRPQSTAVSFVIVDFRRCRGFAKGWIPEGMIFESCTLLNYPSLCSPILRGGVKQLTCGPEKYVTSVFIVMQGIRFPLWQCKCWYSSRTFVSYNYYIVRSVCTILSI